MLEFVNPILHRWHFNAITIAVIINLLLICMLAPLAEPRGANALAKIKSSNANQNVGDADSSPNIITDGFSVIGQRSEKAVKTAAVKFFGFGVSLTGGITYFDKSIGHGTEVTAGFMLNAAGSAFAFAAYPFSHIHNFAHLNSIITPEDHTPTPTITQLRAQQTAIIQQGTIDLSTASTANTASGGACDAGTGNGGYPISWCNSPMDTIQTVLYSPDLINRECTSYAYWYFTTIEGHTNFRVAGNAKYWAGTSNYPTYTSAAVGAIAVETAGAYGHVAIVQALPGQQYAGQQVPAGYVLVSEMNYDWNGHFRYSYSPLNKFSRYIYP